MPGSIQGSYSTGAIKRYIHELTSNKIVRQPFVAASGLQFSAREILLTVITLGIYAAYRAYESGPKVKLAVSFVDHLLDLADEPVIPSTSIRLPEGQIDLTDGLNENNEQVVYYSVDGGPREILCSGTLVELRRKLLALCGIQWVIKLYFLYETP